MCCPEFSLKATSEASLSFICVLKGLCLHHGELQASSTADVEVVSPFQGGKAIISVEADKIMYRNAVKFAWRLIIDMLSSLQLSASGVKVRLEVSSDVKSASKSLKLSQLDLKPYEKSCQPLIREWIDQRKLPLPRSLQESLYTNLLRLLAYCAAAAVESSQLDVFGVTVDPRM